MSQAQPAPNPVPDPLRGPGLHLQLLELLAPFEGAGTLALWPLWPLAPAGDGHAVLVLPGLATGDGSTLLLRRFLMARGWSPHGWNLGLNLGFRPHVMDTLRERVPALARASGRRISLVGWSLGGVMARELAKELPEHVRCVISMGSPFTGHPRQTNAWRLYERVSGHRITHEDLHLPLRSTPPVPTTSIYSRTDGVVSWRCSVERRQPQAESIEVPASHLGMGLNLLVLLALADRLAQPEGQWQPFARAGWRTWFYGNPPDHAPAS